MRLGVLLGALFVLGSSLAHMEDRQVTADRLRSADKEPENWLHYGGTYRSLRYSPLDQINTKNVSTMKAAWAFDLGTRDSGMQSTPLVADGVMYAIGTGQRVFAIDAATGAQKWKYYYGNKPGGPPATARGLAIGQGHVYFGTGDNNLVALDIATGQEVWKTLVHDKSNGCSMSAAPLVVNDVVIVGETGGDQAHRGHLSAYDAKTGQQRWWFNIIPGPGEKGHETWAGDSWMYGGGAPWLTGSYDPELDLVYWGTSNPSSDLYGEDRQGDNLYTNSVIALKPSTGELVWHRQTVPHDVWDYDSVYEQILVDLPVNGRPRKLMLHPDKSGFIHVLDRTNGAFVSAFKYVDNMNWTTGLDKNGIPQNRHEPEADKTTLICPGAMGGRSFNQATFSPKTGFLYNVGIEWCGDVKAHKQEMVIGKSWLAGDVKHRLPGDSDNKLLSHIDAYEPISGRRVWRVETKHPILGALLSTGGDLVFAGDPEGRFWAYDAKTGQKLWSFQTGSGHNGGPISYAVNGRQYIATPSGFGSYVAGTLALFFPELQGSRQGSTIYAFTLPDDRRP
jgi:alcohol dehydrogenase (cytochrome c)